jgi:hypothetical protein
MLLLAVWKLSSVHLQWNGLLSLSYACARPISQGKGLSRTARLDSTTLVCHLTATLIHLNSLGNNGVRASIRTDNLEVLK